LYYSISDLPQYLPDVEPEALPEVAKNHDVYCGLPGCSPYVTTLSERKYALENE